MKYRKSTIPSRVLALLLAVVLCLSMTPTAFAGQENGYHDPAEHWLTANNRTNELDANATVTRETFTCGECGKPTSFAVFRTPEYTRDGVTALSRNVLYSDGTMVGGEGKGSILDGTPGVDAYYTGYHWTKAVCENCGSINTNMATTDYGYLKNVYWLYDCAAEFMEDLDETVTYEYADSTYHTKTTTGGTYCCFCYGTNKTETSVLERHDLETEVLPQPANGRYAIVEHCTLCDYASYEYVTAKSVIADYYGVVDGAPHTITVTDLSEAGVRTSIRYGNSADACTLTSAPNYTEEGQYTVYYEITYTYDSVEMTENGVAYVWLRDDTTDDDGNCTCGCGNPDCGCQDKSCNGSCCNQSCDGHNFILLDSTQATCLTLGYDRYLCTECGKIEKRDYTDSLGHAWQGVLIREATCETDGKLLEICSRCGQVKVSATSKGEHRYETYSVKATCTSPGYTVKECSVCGDRHITDITSALAHNYKSCVTPATCETGGHTVHLCDGCGSSFITDYTSALGHSWDEGTTVTDATCTGEGVTEYRCVRCGYHRIEGDTAAGHVPGEAATCTDPQLCTKCGAVLEKALGHDYQAEVTAPTCTEMGFTVFTCSRCSDSYKGDYTDATGHTPGDWIIDKEPTTDSEGEKHKECENCSETLETAAIEKIYMQAVTDTHGEAIVGSYLVTVTDTDTANPVVNATVTLNANDTLSIALPSGRLLDYADQTTVTVQLVADKSPVVGMSIAITDQNANYCADTTNAKGRITVPGTSASTNGDGKATVGWEDADGDRWTLTVQVEHTETGRPIEDAVVSVGKTGTVTVTLPGGTDLDANHRVTVTVTDQEQAPQNNVTVIVKNDLGSKEQGQTNKDGKLTVPSTLSAYTDDTGTAVVGQYTVIVTDSEKAPVVKALVTLIEGGDDAKDAFTVLLPDGRLLDANDKTTVTILLPTAKPATGLHVTVLDAMENHAAKDTDSSGQITVPDATGSAGEIIGRDTGDEEISNTVNVDVTDRHNKPVEDAEIQVDKDGKVSVVLPDDFTFEDDGPVTVTVTDNQGQPKKDAPVSVRDGAGVTASGETDTRGRVTLPTTRTEQHSVYILGYPNGNFGPEYNMTRSEAAAIFARLLATRNGDTITTAAITQFDDVPAHSWYSGYVKYLTGYNVIYGRDADTFAPDAAITRAEFVAMAVRFFDAYGTGAEEIMEQYKDFTDVSSGYWAAEYIKDAAIHGWIVGYGDGTFRADRYITRAEVVTIVNRLLGREADVDYIAQNLSKLNTFPDVPSSHWAYYDVLEAANGHTAEITQGDEAWSK